MNTLTDFLVEIYNVKTIDPQQGGKVIHETELMDEAVYQHHYKADSHLAAAQEAVKEVNWIPPELPVDNDSYRYSVEVGVRVMGANVVHEHTVLTSPDLILQNPFLMEQMTRSLKEVCDHIVALRAIGYYKFRTNQSIDIGEICDALNYEKRDLQRMINQQSRRPNAVRWCKYYRSKDPTKKNWIKFIVLTREATSKLFTMPPSAVTYQERIRTVYEALGQNATGSSPYSVNVRSSVEFRIINGYGLFSQFGR